MKVSFVFLFLSLFVQRSFAQDLLSLDAIKPGEAYENIFVQKLSTSAESTTFIIWVKNEVKLHKHDFHTEQIYVLEGKGLMKIGNTEVLVKKGDFMTIPKEVAHSVTVLSKRPLKVLSVQAPEFLGDDRIFIEQ